MTPPYAILATAVVHWGYIAGSLGLYCRFIGVIFRFIGVIFWFIGVIFQLIRLILYDAKNSGNFISQQRFNKINFSLSEKLCLKLDQLVINQNFSFLYGSVQS